MPNPPQMPVVIGGFLLLAAGLAVLAVVANRLILGLPVLPYVRRRPVPWGAFHVGAIAATFVLAQLSAVQWLDLPAPSANAPASEKTEETAPPHHLITLIQESHTLPTFLLCLFSAVIVAPIVEEFLFRLLLQGWLEAVEMRLRRRLPGLRKSMPGVLPVLLVALLFAGIHYRGPSPPMDVQTIIRLILATMAAQSVVLVFGVALLRGDAGARAEDLGIVPRKFLEDVRLGVLTFVGLAAVIYLLKISLSARMGENIADPLALFPFALALGMLYYRTHRLTPCIVLHMSLNFTSLMLAWFLGL